VKNILRSWTGNSAQQADGETSVSVIRSDDVSKRLELLDDFEQAGISWLWATDADARLVYLSSNAAENLQKPLDELLTKPLVELFETDPDSPGGSSARPLKFQLTARNRLVDQTVRLTVGRSKHEGRQTWWSLSGTPKFDKSGEFLGYRGSAKDITVEYERQLEDSRLAEFDSLTGLANRHRMNKRLESILASYKSTNRSCALMMLDLDRFKQVNDTFGHPVGDDLLKQVAKRLQRVVGHRGEVGRLGGDEFQIIMPDEDDRGALGDLADRIIRSLSQPYSIDGSRCIIGASVGIAVSPFDGQSSEDLIRSADLALYAAKGSGRGRFRFYSSDLLQAAEDRRVLEEDLRDALVNGQMWVAYQPVVAAQTNIVTGFEALIRWKHPERGNISPALFIPIAEDANLITDLGEWVLRKACQEAATWPGKMKVAVNVSPIQFASDTLPQLISSALADSGLPPGRLELEITESVFLQDGADTDKMFAELKKLGVRLALDDFGTGYSSLGYLKTAPFDKIKIDQSFVRDATQPESRNGAIISAIVALAEALGMETTAEGIESLDQLSLIRDLRVSHVQGYVYSQPVGNDVLLEKCEAGAWEIAPSGPAVQRSDRLSMYRKIGAIHDDHYYKIVLRNLSMSGALIEGIIDVPVGTKFVIDFGDGQLAVSTVVRSNGTQQGIEFEERLVSDGNGGLCTSRRVSPYMMAAAGVPITSLPPGYYDEIERPKGKKSIPAFNTVSDWKAG